MLTSKQRAELRSQANGLDTTLMVGKSGVTDAVIAEAENLLRAGQGQGAGGRADEPPGGL